MLATRGQNETRPGVGCIQFGLKIVKRIYVGHLWFKSSPANGQVTYNSVLSIAERIYVVRLRFNSNPADLEKIILKYPASVVAMSPY
jgi:hypothetical protein